MSAVWATNTNVSTIGGALTILYPGDQVPVDTSWLSPSRQFRLWFQTDGNLVLYDESDSSVLWASATDGMDADTLIMQEDGNLVIYAGGIFGTPLWSSATAGSSDAYLVLQNDGNLVIYDTTGLQNYALVSIPPDWGQPITEMLEWMTSVTESPQAVEQRMGLRISPRQSFEIGYVIFGPTRTHFDALTMAGSGSPLYLPLWHDRGFLDTDVSAGASALNIDTKYTEFQDCSFLVLMRDQYNYELAEIDSFTDTAITLAAPLNNSWERISTKVYPVKKVRVETQPSGDRQVDRAARFRMRFQSMEANKSNSVATLGTFMNNYVLETEPNEIEPASYTYNRKMFVLDGKTSIPLISDVAPFLNQSHGWFAKGREKTWRLRGMLYALQGRRVPIWVPSYFADFDLIADVDAADTNLDIARCGYTDTGGPFKNREYILIHMRNGTRLYRKITSAVVVGAEGLSERLTIDTAPGVDLTPDNVLRISFISFSRLDQDAVELTHHTDSKGVTTANLVWRTDPGIGPSEPPDMPPVIDPWKVPDQLLFGYHPFSSLGIAEPPAPPPSDYVQQAWQRFKSDIDTGFPRNLININVGNTIFTVPNYGSVRITAKSYFISSHGRPILVGYRIDFVNSTKSPITIEDSNSLILEQRSLSLSFERFDVASVLVDPGQGLGIRTMMIAQGWEYDEPLILGMNVFSSDSPTGDHDPYQSGDSFLQIEWWS